MISSNVQKCSRKESIKFILFTCCYKTSHKVKYNIYYSKTHHISITFIKSYNYQYFFSCALCEHTNQIVGVDVYRVMSKNIYTHTVSNVL